MRKGYDVLPGFAHVGRRHRVFTRLRFRTTCVGRTEYACDTDGFRWMPPRADAYDEDAGVMGIAHQRLPSGVLHAIIVGERCPFMTSTSQRI